MKKTDNNIYNEIPDLIARWYSADLSPAEETRLRSFFEKEENCPEEYKVDREIFLSLSSTEIEENTIPSEFESRINSALDREISMTRESRRLADRLRLRWRWGIACVVAISLLLGVVGKWLSEGTELTPRPQLTAKFEKKRPETPERLAEAELTTEEGETAPEETIQNLHQEVRKKIAKAEKRPDEKPKSNKVENTFDNGTEILSSPENYRIIDNQSEAAEILGSIFSKIENTLQRESLRLTSLRLDYESEIVKVNNLEKVYAKEQIAI